MYSALTDRRNKMKKTIVIGLGDPILGDDSLGWKVAQTVKERLSAEPRFRLAIRPIGSKSILKTAEGIGADIPKQVDLVAVEG